MARIPGAARYLTGTRAVIDDYPGPADPVANPVEVGDLVRLDTGTGRIVVVSDADPTNMLGIAKSHNTTAPRGEPVDATRILVEHFTDDVAIWLEGTRAPLATDKGKSYGLAYDDGIIILDATDTVNTRVYVTDIDLGRAAYFCIVLTAHRQSVVGN